MLDHQILIKTFLINLSRPKTKKKIASYQLSKEIPDFLILPIEINIVYKM